MLWYVSYIPVKMLKMKRLWSWVKWREKERSWLGPTSIQVWEKEVELILEFYRHSKKVFWYGGENEGEVGWRGN